MDMPAGCAESRSVAAHGPRMSTPSCDSAMSDSRASYRELATPIKPAIYQTCSTLSTDGHTLSEPISTALTLQFHASLMSKLRNTALTLQIYAMVNTNPNLGYPKEQAQSTAPLKRMNRCWVNEYICKRALCVMRPVDVELCGGGHVVCVGGWVCHVCVELMGLPCQIAFTVGVHNAALRWWCVVVQSCQARLRSLVCVCVCVCSAPIHRAFCCMLAMQATSLQLCMGQTYQLSAPCITLAPWLDCHVHKGCLVCSISRSCTSALLLLCVLHSSLSPCCHHALRYCVAELVLSVSATCTRLIGCAGLHIVATVCLHLLH